MKFVTKILILLFMLFGAVVAQNTINKEETITIVTSKNKDDYPLSGIHLKLGLSCKDCHLEEKESDYSSAMNGSCLNCHGSYEKLAEATGHLGHNNNVHANPHFPTLDCDMCHKAHKPTVNYCLSCHGQDTMKSLIVK